jgi:hypothetical protein
MASDDIPLAGCAGFGSAFDAASTVPAAPATTPPTAPAAAPLTKSLRVSPFCLFWTKLISIFPPLKKCFGLVEYSVVYFIP